MITFVGTFLTWDNFSTVYFMNEGSFVFPLKGIGAKYGESVSTKSLSTGIYDAASTKSEEFLKVTIPLIDIKHPISKSFFA